MYYFLSALGLIIQGLFIKSEHDKRYLLAVILKGTASFIFVIFGLLTARYCSDAKMASLIKLGLLFGMMGDILLNLRYVFAKKGNLIFLVGILVFMIGHIFYLVAILPACNYKTFAIGAGAVATFLLLRWIFSIIEAKTAFKIFGIFYIGAIVIMNCVALCNLITVKSVFYMFFCGGALLFLLSDIVLIINTFGKESKFAYRICNLLLYYVGQLIIAYSLIKG